MHIWGIFSAVAAVNPDQVREMAGNTEGRIMIVKALAMIVGFMVYAIMNIKKYKVGNVDNHIRETLAKKHGSRIVENDRLVRVYADFVQAREKCNKQNPREISYKEALNIAWAEARQMAAEARRGKRRGNARRNPQSGGGNGAHHQQQAMDMEQQNRFMQESSDFTMEESRRAMEESRWAMEESLKSVTPFDFGGYVQGDGFNPSDTMAADAQRQEMNDMNNHMNDMGGMGMF